MTIGSIQEGWHVFIPSQPEVKYKMEKYMERKPIKPSISRYVALFYQFRTPKELVNPFSIIPDGCFDILFCCCPKNPSVFLWTSPVQRCKQLEFKNNCEYFGVRFLPEQSVIKLKNSMRELLSKKIPLESVMTVDAFITEKISLGKTFQNRVHLFEEYIESLTDDFRNPSPFEYSIRQIYLNKGMLNINQLSVDTGFSDRYIRKQFEERIGFSPKQFSEIVRFQNSLSMIFHDEEYSLLDIVHENGYHDQSHFINRFKKFTDVPPNQFKTILFDKKQII